ncbi:MAG: LON peptidase substrate-binding domain-containing protein [Candidatus Manganitrophus sp.]|nr:LON peptidase substrate-binding domain-containing protein [Candidatus Manganitrophus sp.]
MSLKDQEKQKQDIPEKLPLLPVRDIVVFPHMIVPLFVGREKSVKALEEALMKDDKQIPAGRPAQRRPGRGIRRKRTISMTSAPSPRSCNS